MACRNSRSAKRRPMVTRFGYAVKHQRTANPPMILSHGRVCPQSDVVIVDGGVFPRGARLLCGGRRSQGGGAGEGGRASAGERLARAGPGGARAEGGAEGLGDHVRDDPQTLDWIEETKLQTRGYDPATGRRPRVKGHGMAAALFRHIASRNFCSCVPTRCRPTNCRRARSRRRRAAGPADVALD